MKNSCAGACEFFHNKYKVTYTNSKIIHGKSDYSLSTLIGILKSFTYAKDSGMVSICRIKLITLFHDDVIIQWK